MKKAASIFLRADMEQRDVEMLIRWMENPNVTRFLNEDPRVVEELRQLLWTVPAPMLSFHFNRWGHFYLICRGPREPIGFVKLRPLGQPGGYEIVYAIGEESLWGHGYGESAIRAALAMVFGSWQGREVVAKIYPENHRSVRLVTACGFSRNGEGGPLHQYRITAQSYALRELLL